MYMYVTVPPPPPPHHTGTEAPSSHESDTVSIFIRQGAGLRDGPRPVQQGNVER